MKDVRPFRLLVKALVIFLVFNLGFAAFNPPIGSLSVYNGLVPGRLRFFLGNRRTSIVSVGNLVALFDSHIISDAPKTASEYRVLVLGDSQTWGATITPAQTLTEQLNAANLSACGKQLRFYNLAFPYPSVVKDFLILNHGLRYQPDLIIWMLSADSLIPSKALNFLTNGNPETTLETLHQYRLDRYASGITYSPVFWEHTIFGQRGYLASLTLLQLYGPVWGATGLDYQVAPYSPLAVDLQSNQKFHWYQPPHFPQSLLALDVLDVTHKMIGSLPVLVVNEPMYMPPGKNSDIRYNSDYPRWAYDQYRQFLLASVTQNGWTYLDLYNLIAYTDFTNTNFHLNPDGEVKLAGALAPEILRIKCH
jgi:hypothetical protein